MNNGYYSGIKIILADAKDAKKLTKTKLPETGENKILNVHKAYLTSFY